MAVNASSWHAHVVAWISTVSATSAGIGAGGPPLEAYHATAAAAVMATANVVAAAVVDHDDDDDDSDNAQLTVRWLITMRTV